MTMTEAVRSVLSKYATFEGRARRSEYWYFVLAFFLAYIVAAIIDLAVLVNTIGFPIFIPVLFLAAIIPSIAVAVRRLHDTDRSGWWYLLGFVPFGGIVLIVFYCLDSTPDNQYGPSPKAGTAPLV